VKVETITIDLWGTLLFDGPASDNRYKKRRMADFSTLLAAAGFAESTSSLDRAYDESGAYLSRIWSTHRDVPGLDHVRAILAAMWLVAALLSNRAATRQQGTVQSAELAAGCSKSEACDPAPSWSAWGNAPTTSARPPVLANGSASDPTIRMRTRAPSGPPGGWPGELRVSV